MTTLLTGIQAVNIGGLVLLLAACVYLYFRFPNMRELLVPPGIWAAYGVVFYALILTGRLSGDELLLWGAIHRMLVIYICCSAR